MTEEEAYKQLKDKSPTGYRLNELIQFSYPVRKIRLDVLVNKQPDGSLVKVYNVLLRAIQAGFSSQDKLFTFLGLGQTDEFVLRELFTLREKGLVDLVSEKWIVTEEGEKFIQDEKILRVEEKEEFEFLIDGISGEIMSARQNRTGEKLLKSLDPEVKLSKRNPELIEGKFQQLADTYKEDNENKAYLISYDPEDIKYDSNEWCNFWLIEYIPDKKSNQEPKLEVRNFETLKEIKSLTSKFNSEYRHYIYSLSSSERREGEEIIKNHEESKVQSQTDDLSTLTIWETKQKFIEALNNVKEKILIESPWIKRATKEYIPLFEKILKDKKQLIILYGNSEKDEHDIYTLRKLEELQKQHKDKFKLIHLPTHFAKIRSGLTGTHRKLVIKDNEYYIQGSFNFLSFGKNERQRVANEESLLISKDVSKKWEQVAKEYSLKL
ncbi:MAG: hypothetical protein KatS3mg028_1464 [Bacteroidia bacterium]|nr:MAG: hypothetical protein KatS3mg028_1464 [Bacteroidia bacterium]